jgi:5-formyltetrahydrofolate cyclo-ligase
MKLTSAIPVGLCLAEQVLPPEESLVMQDWDWKVDAVAVGDGRLLTATSA